MKIYVAGGYDETDVEGTKDIVEFAKRIGEEVIEQGHTLINSCLTPLDALVANSAYEKAKASGHENPDRCVISYVLSHANPVHNVGKIIQSKLENWELGGAGFYVPEPIAEADVCIFLGGYEGTFRAANWARINRKPILPITAFGGASEELYYQEYEKFDQLYSGRIDKLDYQELNVHGSGWRKRAQNIVSLAEKISSSTSVVAIMSYSGRTDLEDAYDSFVTVCSEFGYSCARVDNTNTEGRIVPAILKRIDKSAFAIVDLTDLRPNVFYELGYADGIKKPVVLTAKDGTDLPFDIKDVPVIYWEGQRQLKDALRAKIQTIADKHGRGLGG
jgi:nucleoside 2-deoxyribosyltransferase